MSAKSPLAEIIEIKSLVEIHTKSTHETWLATAEAVEDDRLRVEVCSAGVIGIPYWHEAALVQCMINGNDGRYHVEAVVLKQSGGTLWLHIPPILTRVDRRKHPRITGAFPVSYRTEEMDGIAVCLDVSAGGMRLRMSGELKEGTTLDLYFVLPGDPLPVRAQASVVHSYGEAPGTAGADVGVHLTTISSADCARIAHYCRLSAPASAPESGDNNTLDLQTAAVTAQASPVGDGTTGR